MYRRILPLTAALLLALGACSETGTTPDPTPDFDMVPALSEVTDLSQIPMTAPGRTGEWRPQFSHLPAGDPNLIHDRATFEASGVIVHNNDFEDFGEVSFFSPGPAWSDDGVTYLTPDNLLVGTAQFSYPVTSTVFCYNFWTPIDAEVSTSPDEFSLFGFDLSVLGRVDPIDVVVHTNAGTYSYNDIGFPGAPGSDFFGFRAPAGEHVTAFHLNSDGSGSAPCLDNVTLGIARIAVDATTSGAINVKSKGLTPVTILGTADFDVTSIDASTVTFGPAAAASAHGGHLEDADGDGDLDMVFHFSTQATGIACGDTTATITGATTSGITIVGDVAFKTTGCK